MLKNIEIPKHAWDTICLHFPGPFENGSLLFAIIGVGTRYSEFEIVRSTLAKSIIASLERVFATHGLPNTNFYLRMDHHLPATILGNSKGSSAVSTSCAKYALWTQFMCNA